MESARPAWSAAGVAELGSGCPKSRLSSEQPRSAIPVAGCGRSTGHWIRVGIVPPSTSEPLIGIVMSQWSVPREIGSAGPVAMGQAAIACWISSTAATHPTSRGRSASRERMVSLSRPNQRGRVGGSAAGSTAITSSPNNSSDRPKSAQATKHLGQRFHCKKLHQTAHSHSCERYQRLGFDRAFLVNNAG